MQLKVRVTDRRGYLSEEDADNEFEVLTFRDADKIAARVATIVRNFIRTAPVRPSRHRTTFLVDAWWDADPAPAPAPASAAPRPKRKRKEKK
jgi:hypothetical protein